MRPVSRIGNLAHGGGEKGRSKPDWQSGPLVAALAEGEFEMFEMQADLLKRISDMRRADAERQAENWRLARLARVGQRGWLSRQGCWLLCQLGHVLVALGRWLEGYGAPRPVSLKG